MGYNQITLPMTVGTGGVEKGRWVKLSSGTIVHAAADTDAIIGVTKNGGNAGEKVDVVISGEADLRVSAALTLLGEVTTDANARAKDAESADTVGAIAMEAGVAASGGEYAFAKVNVLDRKYTKA